MATADRDGDAPKINLAEAKRYIGAGNASIARAYFKESRCVETAEVESKGLYCFEKLVRHAFVQAMNDDSVLGVHDGFLDYLDDLNSTLDSTPAGNWNPKTSAGRVSDFMLSFYNMYSYQWKQHGRNPEKTLIVFLDIMHECLDYAYLKLDKTFAALPGDIKSTIKETFSLANASVDGWYDSKKLEISAA